MIEKALVFITILALLAASAALCGCGDGETISDLNEQERIIDDMLREAQRGNYQPVIELIPPGYEQMASEFEQMARSEFGKIVEVDYRTEEIDEDHVLVYFWGTFEISEDGEVESRTISEEEAQFIPLERLDGRWYFDLGEPPE